MSIFSPDLSIQITGDSTLSKTYNTKDNPNLTFHSRAGIYNSADNTIKIFTNNVDALTIDANQKVICNGSLITNITWNNIDGKPTNFPTNWDNVSAKPSIFPTNWDNVASKPTNFQADWLTTVTNRPEFAAVATTGNWNDLLFVPDLFDGTWTSLSGKPTNFQADWNTTVLNRPTLFDGTWTSLSGKPTNFQADWLTTVTKQRLWYLCTNTNDFKDTHQTLIRIKCHEFDKYGRILITAFRDNEELSINQQMINEGHGYAYDGGTKNSQF